jgi:hypothetical protein
VQLVSAEANAAASADGKQTITPEHVLTALDKAGFGDLVPEVRLAWEAFKDDAKQGGWQGGRYRVVGGRCNVVLPCIASMLVLFTARGVGNQEHQGGPWCIRMAAIQGRPAQLLVWCRSQTGASEDKG